MTTKHSEVEHLVGGQSELSATPDVTQAFLDERRAAHIEEIRALVAENVRLREALRALFNACDTGDRKTDGTPRGVRVPEKFAFDLAKSALEAKK